MTEHTDDFTKIIRAADGAQVLVYKDNGDEGPELVIMTAIEGATLRLGSSFKDTDEGGALRDKAFANMGTVQADKAREVAREFIRGQND